MADQKINALPVKTAPATGDKMLMIGAAEEYQIDYDQLATAILNKLTSKTYALDQGTKTLVAALNELNSNFLYDTLLLDGNYNVRLVDNQNIDIIYKNGVYAAVTDNTAISIQGIPDSVQGKFILIVSDSAGFNYGDLRYKRHTILQYNSNNIFTRFFTTENWSAWREI